MGELRTRSRRAGSMRRSLDHGLDRAPASSIRSRSPGPVSARPRLLETPYCTIDWDAQRSFVRFVRTERPYATIGDIEHDGREVQRALEEAGAQCLLVDLRAVTPRNDASFEIAITD